MSEPHVPYNAMQPIAPLTAAPIDGELTPTERAIIRRLRNASNAITSPFGQSVLTIIVKPRGKRHMWFVSSKEENVQLQSEGSE